MWGIWRKSEFLDAHQVGLKFSVKFLIIRNFKIAIVIDKFTMTCHLFCGCCFFCSDLFGIDMNNPSLEEKSSGNGHVSISGK